MSDTEALQMARTADADPQAETASEGDASRDKLATESGAADGQELEHEGLSEAVFELVNTFPPELLRGLNSSVPGVRVKRGLDLTLPPMSSMPEIFDDLAKKAHANGFGDVLNRLGSRPLRVATMCSGTESPLLALKMLSESYERHFGRSFHIHHLFSAEIDPVKQSYIQRNFSPDILFRDVTELTGDEATTAFGSLKPVPQDPELLVVGFSCVDFSTLNTKKKKLESMGESGVTFNSVTQYMDRSRPPLVVLENVSGAPWTSISEVIGDIGYDCYHVRVDTKDYYYPQTRERGYMFCVDRNKLPAPLKKTEFANLMRRFERKASAPLTQFLLRDHDPRLEDARADISANARNKHEVDWTRYKARHLKYRLENGLGSKRPLSKWQDNGTCKMPDFAWHDWARGQSERVWDTLDMNHLRTIARGYDINFKCRVLDLSQGVDREIDERAFGVAGCLTPRGIHYITSRGGPVTGIEALALQGIPIERLLLNNDSQQNLYDLAGNAMTSTVVGAAMLSALILGYQALPPSTEYGVPERPEREQLPQSVEVAEVAEMTAFEASRPTLVARDVAEMAKASARLCLCEGRTLSKQRGLQRCTKCAHTTCIHCGDNPPHEYEKIPVDGELEKRISPGKFERLLKQGLPMRLCLAGLSLGLFNSFRPEGLNGDIADEAQTAWVDFMKAVASGLGDELQFREITRQRSWIIRYEGPNSILQLTCSRVGLRWSLYSLPPKEAPSNSPIRQILLRPVAWMAPSGDSLLEGVWHVVSPMSSSFEVLVQGRGPKIDAAGSRAGLNLPVIQGSTVWAGLTISATDEKTHELEMDICGDYELLEDCGAASSSLHKKLQTNPGEDIYLFLDPAEIGPPEFDSWVFATEHDRLDIGQVRHHIAEVRPHWSAFRLNEEPQAVRCWYRRNLQSRGIQLQEIPNSYQSSYLTVNHPRGRFIPGIVCKDEVLPVMTCKLPATGIETDLDKGAWESFDLADSADKLRKFAWLLQPIFSFNAFNDWTTATAPTAFPHDCQICAPPKPRLLWAKDAKDRLYAYEDLKDAAVYERSVKERPAILTGWRMVDDQYLHFKLCVNLATLFHQATGNLGIKDGLEFSWRARIDTSGFVRPRLPQLLPPSNKEDGEHSQPPGFISISLRPEQRRSLTWMVRQERHDAAPFVEQEVVEALVPSINWRIDGRATANRMVRGGILGDNVGYGKTILSLALIDVQYGTAADDVPEFMDGAFPIKATLIIIPDHLLNQWNREIKRFLGDKYRVVVLTTLNQLRALNFGEIWDVDIVLMSMRLLQNEGYYKKLEVFAGASTVPNGTGRIFEQWLKDALAGTKEHVDVLAQRGGRAVNDTIIAKLQRLRTEEGLTKYRPSKRPKGEKLQSHLAAVQRAGVDTSSDVAAALGLTVDAPDVDAQRELAAGLAWALNSLEAEVPPELAVALEPTIDAPDAGATDSQRGSKRKRRQPSEDIDHPNKSQKPEGGDGMPSEMDEVMEETEHHQGKNHQAKRKTQAPAQGRSKIPAIRKVPNILATGDVNPDSIFGFLDAEFDWRETRYPLVHMFEWNRVIIDEFTYTKDRAYPSMIAIPTRKRWILSGTPPLSSFADVKTYSPLLGVQLGIDEDGFRSSKNARLNAIIRERTAVEKFQPLATRRTAAWHEERHGVAQRFLDQFMRKNEPKIEDIEREEHIRHFFLPTQGQAQYLELFMQVNIMNPRGKAKVEGRGTFGSRAVARRDDILGTSLTPAEALLKSASLVPSPSTGKILKTGGNVLEDIEGDTDREDPAEDRPKGARVTRSLEFRDLAGDVTEKLELGFYFREKILGLRKNTKQLQDLTFDDFLGQIGRHELGDLDIMTWAENLMKEAKTTWKAETVEALLQLQLDKKTTSIPTSIKDLDKALRICTDSLYRLINEAITRSRAARLYYAICSFRLSATFTCDICWATVGDPQQFFVLGECGHGACAGCLDSCCKEGDCLHRGCTASVVKDRIVKCDDLGHDEGIADSDNGKSNLSRKNAELVKLLKDIPKDEHALLFIQFPELAAEAKAALDAAGIGYSFVDPEGSKDDGDENDEDNQNVKAQGKKKITSKSKSQRMSKTRSKSKAQNKDDGSDEDMKEGAQPQVGNSRVVILTLGDVTASGLNMQFANHVIFYSPLLVESQQEYDAGMQQAIGRSIRYGQKRCVHIYHLLALKTIDIDIFEQRRHQALVRRDGEFLLVPSDDTEKTDERFGGRPLRGFGADRGDDYDDDEED